MSLKLSSWWQRSTQQKSVMTKQFISSEKGSLWANTPTSPCRWTPSSSPSWLPVEDILVLLLLPLSLPRVPSLSKCTRRVAVKPDSSAPTWNFGPRSSTKCIPTRPTFKTKTSWISLVAPGTQLCALLLKDSHLQGCATICMSVRDGPALSPYEPILWNWSSHFIQMSQLWVGHSPIRAASTALASINCCSRSSAMTLYAKAQLFWID